MYYPFLPSSMPLTRLILFANLFSMWSTPPPPPPSAVIPKKRTFSTIHVCTFSFKRLSQRFAWNGYLGIEPIVSSCVTLNTSGFYLWSSILNWIYIVKAIFVLGIPWYTMVLWLLLFRDISEPASSNHILYMYEYDCTMYIVHTLCKHHCCSFLIL